MPNPNVIENLLNILAKLYRYHRTIRHVAIEAGINTSGINIGSSEINSWQVILAEAERSDKLNSLLTMVLKEYPENIELLKAVNDYRASIAQSSNAETTSSPSISNDVNTSSGPYVAGNVSTDSGDFTGRDKTVQGDEVKGDKVGGDKVGRDSYNINAQNVTIYQYPEGQAATATNKPTDRNEDPGADANPPIQPDVPDKQIDSFLSYSHIDSEIMQRLRADLRSAGFTVWTDDIGLEPGTPSWQRAIKAAIHASRCMVVLLSPEAEQSKWVEIEVSLAEDLGLRIFPLLVRGEERNAVLFRLLTTQRIDVRADYQKAVTEQLVPALHRYLPNPKPSEEIETRQIKLLKASEQSLVEPPTVEEQQIIGSVQASRLDISNLVMTRPIFIGLPRYVLYIVLLSLLIIIGLFTIYLANSFPSTTPTLTMAAISTPTQLPTVTPTPVVTKTNPKDGASYVWIPPGEFMMGSTTDTWTDAFTSAEHPQHRVALAGFWIMQTEVTNAQYKRCIDAKACGQPSDNRWNDTTYTKHPVVYVTWEQAEAYAKWVGGRLPTEAEWEYACRGDDGRIYPWGNTPPSPLLLHYAGGNIWLSVVHSILIGETMPVGSYIAGAHNLYDMAGNVQEWTADWYGGDYFANSLVSNPKGPESGSFRILRGGSFMDYDSVVRCVARLYTFPDYGNYNIGFRVVSDGF